MEPDWVQQAKSRASRILWTTVPLLLLSAVIPIFAYSGLLKPEMETGVSWFQRSGALMVFFAVWSEFRLQSINGIVKPNGFVTAEWKEFYRYTPYWTALRWVGLVFALLGTAIWGYGDLAISNA